MVLKKFLDLSVRGHNLRIYIKGKGKVIVPNNAIKICCFKTIQQAIKRYTSLL